MRSMMLRRVLFQARRVFACDSVNHFLPATYNAYRQFSERDDESIEGSRKPETNISGAFASKYRIFRDEDSPIILDVQEERLNIENMDQNVDSHEEFDEFSGLSLARGVTGVFEVEELVDILKRESMLDIVVVTVPPEIKYVDHMVIVTGKSPRHMYAAAEFVRRVFKKRRHADDVIPKIEGKNSKDWIAMDLGNIALHIFSKTARSVYDLESLWSVGPEYDSLYNKPDDPVVELLLQHSVYLGEIESTETKG